MLVRNLVREVAGFDFSKERIIQGLPNEPEPFSIEKMGVLELKVVEGENCWA